MRRPWYLCTSAREINVIFALCCYVRMLSPNSYLFGRNTSVYPYPSWPFSSFIILELPNIITICCNFFKYLLVPTVFVAHVPVELFWLSELTFYVHVRFSSCAGMCMLFVVFLKFFMYHCHRNQLNSFKCFIVCFSGGTDTVLTSFIVCSGTCNSYIFDVILFDMLDDLYYVISLA